MSETPSMSGDADRQEAGSAVHSEVSGAVYGASVQAGTIGGGVHIHAAENAASPVPAQLLPPPAHFTNRAEELSGLGRLLDESGIVVVTGTGGIGKTSMVLQWLHRIRDRFPGGQLYVDLGGPSAPQPASQAEVLGRFLRALDTDPDRIPVDAEEAGAAFRSLTADRQVVVLADNALSAAQVRQLRPGPAGRLVVTSRYRLTGLAMDGARFLELGPFSERDAMELLDRMLGIGRTEREPDAARSLVDICGRMPIAVCGSAARLATRPRWQLERFVAELGDERRRLALLSVDEDISVRAVFDVSYRALSASAARLYRLLSLHPAVEFGGGVAAAVARVDRDDADEQLGELVAANLLEEIGEDRFRFHDLIRLHARRQADDQESEAERRAAVERIVDWYLRWAAAADLTALPGRWRLNALYDRLREEEPPAFDSPAKALDWLEAELPNLVAALESAHEYGLHDHVWQLCEAMWSLFLQRKRYISWQHSHEIAIASVRSRVDPRMEARVRVQLAALYLHLRRYDEALAQLTEALQLDRGVGHQLGEATALENYGLAYLGLNRVDQALDCFQQALAIFRRIDSPRGVALMMRHVGEAHRNGRRYENAVDHLQRACVLFAELPDPFHEMRSLTSLGQTHLLAGRAADGVDPLIRALVIARRLGSRYEQGRIHETLADVAAQLGDRVESRTQLEHALAAYTDASSPQADEVRTRAAATDQA